MRGLEQKILTDGFRLWRIFATLPLTSKLAALCGANVHPYPRTHRGAYKGQLLTLAESRAKYTARAGLIAAHKRKKSTAWDKFRHRRISLLANIPALVLSELAPYDFVWYVHPYPHVELRC